MALVAVEAGTYFDLDQRAARQELDDEVIVANVRELRAITHVHRKSNQVEADGMDEEQATTKARETDRRNRLDRRSMASHLSIPRLSSMRMTTTSGSPWQLLHGRT
jgi:hypothetical protein